MTKNLIITFDDFINGEYKDGDYSIYIIWLEKQALYVGISRDNIWNRWFCGSRSHMSIVRYKNGEKGLRGDSPIGRAIQYNLPDSRKWLIELINIGSMDIERHEEKLIHELHPIFNTIHLPKLTDDELGLYRRLTQKETDELLRLYKGVELTL